MVDGLEKRSFLEAASNSCQPLDRVGSSAINNIALANVKKDLTNGSFFPTIERTKIAQFEVSGEKGGLCERSMHSNQGNLLIRFFPGVKKQEGEGERKKGFEAMLCPFSIWSFSKS